MGALSIIAFTFGVYFLITSIIVHFIKKEYSFKKDTISKYAIGKNGIIITIGFIIIGLNQFIISWIFFNLGYTIPSIFLALSGMGVIIVSSVKTKKDNKISKAHVFGAAMQFGFFPLALISLIAIHGGNIFTLITGAVSLILALVIGIFYSKYKRIEISNFGLIEKIDILFINAWLIVTPLFIF